MRIELDESNQKPDPKMRIIELENPSEINQALYDKLMLVSAQNNALRGQNGTLRLVAASQLMLKGLAQNGFYSPN